MYVTYTVLGVLFMICAIWVSEHNGMIAEHKFKSILLMTLIWPVSLVLWYCKQVLYYTVYVPYKWYWKKK